MSLNTKSYVDIRLPYLPVTLTHSIGEIFVLFAILLRKIQKLSHVVFRRMSATTRCPFLV